MTLNEIRQKYLDFYKERGHVEIPSSSLVPENDPTTLFTGSGMQPLLPYLLGQPHPEGRRLVDSQKCFRSQDIEEVGDNRHTTFFEMLGNWSLGEYFKEEQLSWLFKFLTEKVGLDLNRFYVTVFIGDEKLGIPKDTESVEIWKRLLKEKGVDAKDVEIGSETDGYEKGMQGGKIFYYDAAKNWWSRSGTPDQMPPGEPGGPDSEIFYEFPDVEHDKKYGEHCHPNCDCGRFVEFGNSVFMQYIKNQDGSFSELPQKNVDFGAGLERVVMVANDTPDIFAVNHEPILRLLEELSGKKYTSNDSETNRAFRIIADHMKGAVFLIASGVMPGNAERGYFVRRLIRRSVLFADRLGIEKNSFSKIVEPIADMYAGRYPEVKANQAKIASVIDEEESRFRKTLERGLKKLNLIIRSWENGKSVDSKLPASIAFELVTTDGFPYELVVEIAKEHGFNGVEEDGFKARMKAHQDTSRAGAAQKFAGGLADHAEQTVRYHTAHHLLLKALQNVLGNEVKQRGSNITQERLRIDFSFPRKMTDEEKREVERIVNKKIEEDLPVIRIEMSREEAEALGAEHEFGQKYPDRVSVYSIGPKDAAPENPKLDERFSIEFCGGPHVTRTGEIGEGGPMLPDGSRASKRFKISKEEAVSAGVRRIKAVLE